MVATLRQLFEAGCRSPGKRLEQTKRGLVWLAIISVQCGWLEELWLRPLRLSPAGAGSLGWAWHYAHVGVVLQRLHYPAFRHFYWSFICFRGRCLNCYQSFDWWYQVPLHSNGKHQKYIWVIRKAVSLEPSLSHTDNQDQDHDQDMTKKDWQRIKVTPNSCSILMIIAL